MPDGQARRIRLSGHVQGVGYRPFVYRLARELGVRGWVRNVVGAVEIHAEADAATLAEFTRALVERAPAIARPQPVADRAADFAGHAAFAILASAADSEPDIHVPPDYFTCDDCLRELRDPADRRHGYPFINCTQCGPRYTLITALPYDRPNTSMAGFPLCPDCRAEYEDPASRRFHAEPVACPVCGPHLSYVDAERRIEGDDDALAATVAALRAGRIVAVKGVGGYHLMCDAASDAAVAELRRRKPRPAKPLAVMFPADQALLRASVRLDPEAAALLASPARPIVLLELADAARLSRHVAPGLAEVGCLLPYSPLHHLLLERFGGALVATSGNISGEPVLTDNAEAQARLAPIADAFLHHDRPIVRPADDPVFRPIAGRPRPLRLGRGVAPLELELAEPLAQPVLALGSHMKNAICLAWGRRAVLSPHIGELTAPRSLETLAKVAEDLQRLYRVQAERILLDRHPGYGYRHWVRGSGLPTSEIWHHRAHASALAWEHPEVAEWIVFAWDGVGLGEDANLWGGEAFVGAPGRWQRRAGLRPFRLPGGDKAGREPWRSAAALLWEAGQAAEFAPELLHQAWLRGLNSPASSAAGRLFDAAAALIGVCSQASFEGEGPMKLEALAAAAGAALPATPGLPLARDAAGVWRTDWSPLLAMLADVALAPATRALAFHRAMADALVAQAIRLREETGAGDVGLTGGVFQNRLLTELAVAGLAGTGFRVRLAERIPVNDAGVSFGQVIEHIALCRPTT
ncbi:carbamoyltransferase HypF [Parasulfuritortus cantonensis]|uniref:Carbamoyltransferase HypF n=1 Tax=Parasulfuritortus cantonensis TaxID=2528202 RepID=A0A4R1B202_9PROT|nr:carbamoyltransferase HypF [Parasulfuritortus cantonensis]TCJ11841.1 carbamoyltransferase HypF [Parasulfuritortus cantonensis]